MDPVGSPRAAEGWDWCVSFSTLAPLLSRGCDEANEAQLKFLTTLRSTVPHYTYRLYGACSTSLLHACSTSLLHVQALRSLFHFLTTRTGSTELALGLVGTTAIPHNLLLGSSIASGASMSEMRRVSLTPLHP